MTRSISIIGVGMVGGTLNKWFPEAKVFDKYKNIGTLEDATNADFVFICIWLTDNGRNQKDLDTLDEIISRVPDGKVVVIKSTVIPGVTDYFQDKYPNKLFVFNPEFLSEATAQYDFEHPPAQLVGCTHQSIKVGQELLDMLPDAPIKAIISPRDAEMYKHARNSYLAMKVIFFNQIYDACQALGVDYETIRNIFIQDPWIAATHTMIYHKGYRGFGTREVSKCLPKDTENLAEEVKTKGGNLELFELLLKLNQNYYDQKRNT